MGSDYREHGEVDQTAGEIPDVKTLVKVGIVVLLIVALFVIFLGGNLHGRDQTIPAVYADGLSAGRAIGYYAGSRDALRDGYSPWLTVQEVEWWLARYHPRPTILEVYDCDNLAIDMAQSAFRDNRMIGILVEPNGEVNHMANFAIVGNVIYRIDGTTLTQFGVLDRTPPNQ